MALQLTAGAVGSRHKGGSFKDAVEMYRARIMPFAALDLPVWESEQALFDALGKQKSRAAPLVVLLDSRGKTFASETFAEWLARERDGGRQSIIFAIGAASGWSTEARGRADLLLSLGPMTLPHELARVVLLEQLYRAFTILAGHPYHTGH